MRVRCGIPSDVDIRKGAGTDLAHVAAYQHAFRDPIGQEFSKCVLEVISDWSSVPVLEQQLTIAKQTASRWHTSATDLFSLPTFL
ncbi:MAG: hypothetical protein ACI841_005188 [Planctomycetota bacterium]|jgi:hypothetical protein